MTIRWNCEIENRCWILDRLIKKRQRIDCKNINRLTNRDRFHKFKEGEPKGLKKGIVPKCDRGGETLWRLINFLN